jgi:hypothetical protein
MNSFPPDERQIATRAPHTAASGLLLSHTGLQDGALRHLPIVEGSWA